MCACSERNSLSLGTVAGRLAMVNPLLLLASLVGLATLAGGEEPAYFPVPTKEGDAVPDYYVKYLRAMREPSLHARMAEPVEEYRSLFLPTWEHPVAIRVTSKDGEVSLRAVVLSGAGGFAPGQILVERNRMLSGQEWKRFQPLLTKAAFWNAPKVRMEVVPDGDRLIFEGTGGYRYRLQDVASILFHEQKALVECGQYLMKLSDLEVDADGRDYFATRLGKAGLYLAAMKEPSLQPQAKVAKELSFRFTWLRRMGAPISIRVWREGGENRARAVYLKLRATTGKLLETDVTRRLAEDEVKELESLLKEQAMWKPLTRAERNARLPVAKDRLNDADWIFERAEKQRHDVIHLFNAERYTADNFKRAGVDLTQVRDFTRLVNAAKHLVTIMGLPPDNEEQP
jgi:hypothetical protein